MKRHNFIRDTLLAGVLVLAPIYLLALLLLKAMKSLNGVVRPLVNLLPRWIPAEHIASFLLVLVICFLVGVIVRTSPGRTLSTKIENGVLHKIPGYDLIRSLTRQMAGQAGDSTWRPALVELEEALVPAFIIEELSGGRFTIFVPSVPTPLVGAVYILAGDRVHPLNIPFAEMIKAVTRWGAGSKDLLAAMEK